MSGNIVRIMKVCTQTEDCVTLTESKMLSKMFFFQEIFMMCVLLVYIYHRHFRLV